MKFRFARFAFESNRVKDGLRQRSKSFSPDRCGEVSLTDVDCLPDERIEEIGKCVGRESGRGKLYGWERLSEEDVSAIRLDVKENGMVCGVPHFIIVGWLLLNNPADVLFAQEGLAKRSTLVKLPNPVLA